MSLQPRFPLYIPSKGRYETKLTVDALEAMRVPYNIIVEEQEYKKYKDVIASGTILVLDKQYQQTYPTCDTLGDEKSKGPGPARNFAWDHAASQGAAWHWVMDDNIRYFMRLVNNRKIRVGDGACFYIMEEFCLRYTNVAMAGPNYDFFAKRKQKLPPFITNTRIYSCNLIRNDVPFRWRGRYNEDTILSLDMLKAGWCTIQFNAFLQGKVATQTVKGGNTAEFYHKEGMVVEGEAYARGGTTAKSEMLARVHPDVCQMKWKFRRWHHHVDYRPFKSNILKKKKDLVICSGVNEFGMKVEQRSKKHVKAKSEATA